MRAWVEHTVESDAVIVREAVREGHFDEPALPTVSIEEAHARLLRSVADADAADADSDDTDDELDDSLADVDRLVDDYS